MPRHRFVVSAVALSLLLAGCSGKGAARVSAGGPSDVRPDQSGPTSGAASPPAAPLPPPLAWVSCGAGFQCSTLTVPLVYGDAGSGSVSLRLLRLPATGPGPRVGSLLINPGGPGVSAVDWLRANSTYAVPVSLRRRFDLVAFDPRGTTGSDPVQCFGTAQLDAFFHVDPNPDDPQELTQFDEMNKAFAAACQRRSGRILAHLSTVDAARDMDSVRAALREPKLTYLGYSYGTALGAAYLDRFPTHVRAMVLDGALDPRLSWDQLLAGQARGFDQALRSFLSWCDRSAKECAYRRVVQGDLGAAFDRLASSVDHAPLPGAGSRTVGSGEFSYGVGQALYSTSFWPYLGTALAAATRGDGGLLLTLSDQYLDRTKSGYDNTIEANYAINCADRPWPKDDAAYRRLADEVRAYAPRFGPGIAWSGAACADWPIPPTGRPHAVSGAGSPPIVVIGTTGDPATPYAWAVGLAKQLQNGVLITHVGDGHTAYRSSAAPCIVDPVDAYLLTGRAPAPLRC